MKLYNVEIISPTFAYRSSGQIGTIQLDDDYLSLDNNTISLQNAVARIDDYIHITDMHGTGVIDGIITSVDEEEDGTKIGYKKLLSLLDVKVERGTVDDDDLEQWVVDKITETYINNTDTYQNKQGMTATKTTATAGVLPEGEILNLYDTAVYLLKKFKIVIHIAVSMAGSIAVTVTRCDITGRTIEADLPNVDPVKILYKGKGTNAVNKVILISDTDGTKSIYYRTSADVVTKTPGTDRITPVVWDMEYVDGGEAFETKAQEKAEELLKLDAFDNLIELTVKADDSLVKPEDIVIGELVTILYKNQSYTSALTAKKYKDGKIRLSFGAIRIELTKILKGRL